MWCCTTLVLRDGQDETPVDIHRGHNPRRYGFFVVRPTGLEPVASCSGVLFHSMHYDGMSLRVSSKSPVIWVYSDFLHCPGCSIMVGAGVSVQRWCSAGG